MLHPPCSGAHMKLPSNSFFFFCSRFAKHLINKVKMYLLKEHVHVVLHFSGTASLPEGALGISSTHKAMISPYNLKSESGHELQQIQA